MINDRLISQELARHIAITSEDCDIACIIAGYAEHRRHHGDELISVDKAVADLTRAIMLFAGTQPRGWREAALNTVARLMLEDIDNPANITAQQ